MSDLQRRKRAYHRHGMKKMPIYQLWQNMLNRCRNQNMEAFKNYGGRGITVCDRWLSFENFYADMGDRPPGKSLDRLDNDKGYSPENCAWRTRKEQGLNTRVNRLVTIEGVTQPLGYWCQHYGVPRKRVTSRLQRGWDEFRALTEPRKKNGTC